jgi:hypothetical protein
MMEEQEVQVVHKQEVEEVELLQQDVSKQEEQEHLIQFQDQLYLMQVVEAEEHKVEAEEQEEQVVEDLEEILEQQILEAEQGEKVI